MPRRADPRPARRGTALAAALIAAALTGGGAAAAAEPAADAQAWRSAFEPRQAVPLGERMIVVLAAPSLAERMERARRPLSAREQRRHVHRTDALQARLVASLRAQGVRIEREHVFARTLNGFSARLGSRALAALERAPGVAGIYPVRAVYPASLSASALGRPELLARHGIVLPGADGSGVTVAVLDTGVDRSHPSLRGRVLWGVDLVEGDAHAEPEPRPDDPAVVETHGTRVAGIVAGGGPTGATGVAPGARILPIRVLGWREGPGGYQSVGSGDVLLAGLERAVDPDGDGDVEDRVEIALAAVVEPYAVFADSPESRAVAGALALGTLVVAPAGNDGSAGDGSLGTIGAPGAAPAALSVGAADTRPAVATSRLTVRVGGNTVFAGEVPLLGGLPPRGTLELPARLPALVQAGEGAPFGLEPSDFRDEAGRSLVDGAAAVLPGDGLALLPKVRNAAAAGARAVLVAGSTLAPGGLGYDEGSAIPVLAIPGGLGAAMGEARAAGQEVDVLVEPAAATANATPGRVARFSSQGPAAGASKPDLVAPGVALLAPDAAPQGSEPRYAAVTGTSAAAAVAAGAAALVLDRRPGLDAAALAGVLVGSARPLSEGGVEPVTRAGAGLVDPSAAAQAGLAVEPATLSFGRGDRAERTILVRNVSGRTLELSLGVATDPDAPVELSFGADPAAASLPPDGETAIRVVVSAADPAVAATASGVLVVQAEGVAPVRVPWTLVVGERAGAAPLVTDLSLSRRSFALSRRTGPVLSFQAGTVAEGRGGLSIASVGLLAVEVETRRGRSLGTLARLRDLLPGRYAIRLTGRRPDGRPLRPGRYVLVLRAWPADAAEGGDPATVTRVPFRIVR